METLPVEILALIIRFSESPAAPFVCGLWFDLLKNFLKKKYNLDEMVKENDYKLIDWALQNGYPLDVILCTAARFGNLRILEKYGNGDYKKTCSSAVKYDKINVLRWIRKKVTVFNEDLAKEIYMEVARSGNKDGFSFLFCEVGYNKNKVDWKSVCEEAALYGQLKVLYYVFDTVWMWMLGIPEPIIDDLRLMFCGIRGGHKEVIKFGYDNSISFDKDCCAEAVKTNNLEILQYLRELNCPWGENVGKVALENGNKEIIQYLQNNNYPFTSEELNVMKEKNLIL